MIATASDRPMLTFRNFSLRCDKSNPQVSFKTPWNWSVAEGKRIAVISNNAFLKYQLLAHMSGFVPSVSGQVTGASVIGWPVGGEGGLDSKLRLSQALGFLSAVYDDCLEKSCIGVNEFWNLLSDVGIQSESLIKELSKDQKDFFYLALSVLFSFDCYLVPKTRFLMSKPAKLLRELLLKQIQHKVLLSTSTNVQFQREFCTDGLVLGPLGEILFSGGLSEAIQWADQNLESAGLIEADDDSFEVDLNFSNKETPDDDFADF